MAKQPFCLTIAKAIVRQKWYCVCFYFFFLKTTIFKRNETRLLCLRLLQSIKLCIINVTKCLVKSHRKLRDYHEYQRKCLFWVEAQNLEGFNLKVFSLEQS